MKSLDSPRHFNTILVTGGAGFIGSHLVRRLVNRYPDVRILNLDSLSYAGNLANLTDIADRPNYTFIHADITDARAITDLFHSHDIDALINLAAETHVDRSISGPLIFADTNTRGTLNLLDAARNAWSEKGFEGKVFYQVSTDEVFGALGPDDAPFCESTPYNPHSPYSASKASADLFVRAYHDTFGLPTLISNCSNNFGPCQFPEKLIPLVVNNIRTTKPIPVYGRGLNVRDWLWVEDHVRAIDTILHHALPGSSYCIGGNNEMRNIDLIHRLIAITDRLLGRPEGASLPLVSFVADRPGHDLRYAIDSSRLRHDLGWEPTPSPEVALEATVRWYLEHDKWLSDITSGAYAEYYKEMYGNR